nr:N-acetyltransferase [Glutamicibacter creatinolyticus]
MGRTHEEVVAFRQQYQAEIGAEPGDASEDRFGPFLPERDRYVLDDAGKHIGAAHYRDYQGENGVERIFFHTVVDEEYSGQGLAAPPVGRRPTRRARAG